MAGAGKCLLWLTALTTVSLAVSGCHAPDGMSPAAAGTPPSSSAVAAPPTPAAHPRRPRHISPPTSQAMTSAVAPVTTTGRSSSVLVISDGSDVVRVGERSVPFPTSVTDATVSPNGMVLAFVDGLGNIATARLDGTGLRVLTSTDPGVRRAGVTFEDGGSEIIFSERGHDGVWRLKEVAADGHDELTGGQADPTVAETARDGGGDTAPSATWSQPSHEAAPRSELLFEHRTSRGRVEVYVADRNQRGFGASSLLAGRAPAVSPTGDRVAYIGAAGQIHVQAFPIETRRPHPIQVTWGANPTGHLVWSPDGRRLYFSTQRDVESVSSTPVRPGHNPVDVVLHQPGVASLGSVARPAVGTFTSTDPVSVALAVSRARYVDGTSVPVSESDSELAWADHVTLLSTSDPSAAAPAAAIAGGGPILFLRDGRLDPRVRDEVLRLMQRPHGFPGGIVDIVGTPIDVPESVTSDLRSAGLRVVRFDPASAASDAARGAREGSSACVVVSRHDLAAVASSVSGTNPVLLTDGASMPAATAARLDRLLQDPASTVYAVGRDAQVAVRSSWSGKRPLHIVDVGGQDTAADSLAAVQGLYDAPGRLSVASAGDWRGMLIAGMAGPTLVVDRALTPAAQGWLAASQPVMRGIYVFGGPAALPGDVGRAVFGDRYVVRHSPTDITE